MGLVSVWALAAAGCSLLTSLDGLDTGSAPAAGPDGAPASPREDRVVPQEEAASPSPDGGVELDAASTLPANGSFEQGSVGCGTGWLPIRATATRVPGGVTGNACKVCNATAGRDAFMMNVVPNLTLGAGGYIVEVQVRREENTGAPDPLNALFYTQIQLVDGGAITGGSPGAISASWQVAQFGLNVPEGATSIYVEVGGEGDPGACVLLDDVVIRAL